ncbi:hypothetical protein ACLB2K_062225 [Fragaria x ananassa]
MYLNFVFNANLVGQLKWKSRIYAIVLEVRFHDRRTSSQLRSKTEHPDRCAQSTSIIRRNAAVLVLLEFQGVGNRGGYNSDRFV